MSSTVRQAVDRRKQVEKFLNHQKDLLSAEAIEEINDTVSKMNLALSENADKKTLETRMEALETVANKRLIPYPNASIRENVDVVLVAVAVALAVRTFFLQPFKIPTGSMQPTLYGITHVDFRKHPELAPKSGMERFIGSWFKGESHVRMVADQDCTIERLYDEESAIPGLSRLKLIKQRRIKLSHEDKPRTIRFAPDGLFRRAGLHVGQQFSKGDEIMNLKVVKGDYLFVNRFTYNFRRPERGDIVVFKTDGIQIPGVTQSLFYIKRLVALGEEKVQIDDDHHVWIDDQRLDSATHRFENVYSFEKETWSREGRTHFGHVNGRTSIALTGQNLAALFYSKDVAFKVGRNRYLVMGDNTMNSLDSRQWGDFPRENVIGCSAFVYWPLSERFGWSHR